MRPQPEVFKPFLTKYYRRFIKIQITVAHLPSVRRCYFLHSRDRYTYIFNNYTFSWKQNNLYWLGVTLIELDFYAQYYIICILKKITSLFAFCPSRERSRDHHHHHQPQHHHHHHHHKSRSKDSRSEKSVTINTPPAEPLLGDSAHRGEQIQVGGAEKDLICAQSGSTRSSLLS